jgi:hypothetical protein
MEKAAQQWAAFLFSHWWPTFLPGKRIRLAYGFKNKCVKTLKGERMLGALEPYFFFVIIEKVKLSQVIG